MWKLTLRLVLGVMFLILGLIGILIPVMPQLIFFTLAALMFFPRHPRLNLLLDKGKMRLPRSVGWLRRIGIGSNDEECGSAPVPRENSAPASTSAYEPGITERQRYPE